MRKWTIVIETDIQDEDTYKLIVWALKKIGMGIVSIKMEEK